ncbi:LysR substrate-binding domain-containing protein [Tahibacter harae]|uniref:LysR substrate-binding domain-containing protein n=1 Tax=Tahibacter harae TaxID=2963937 RepID=A0ABT1QV90_9GAMM|nr:LysR substrate-binding domain-containing protein [Tahibacter harae]MCQ4166212.1 LysR substrate-binding domain-containing protein [Tahibacter harae]
MKSTLDELQVFTAVVDTGSITAAAQRLGQTVSGVSRTLSRLEEKLATTLLRRTTRRLELTGEGELLLQRARRILDAMEEAEDELAQRRQKPAGRLRVDTSAPFMLHVVVPLVAGFRERYPEITLELNTSDLITDLLEHRTDVALRIGALRDSTLHARPLGTSRLRLLASPEYLARRGRPTTVKALARHSLLGFSQPESLNHWPLRHAGGDRLHVKPDLFVSSGETLRHLALAGAGIASLSDFLTAGDRARGELVQVLARDTVEVRQPINAVYYRNTALAARIRCFLDYLAERIGEGWR